MGLTKTWAGKAFGTNVGYLALKLEGDDDALTGTLRMNEEGVGVLVYSIEGNFEAPTLTMVGTPQVDIEGVQLGEMKAVGTMNAAGEIHGDWETTIGTGGNFVLHPHTGGEVDPVQKAEQLHTARHNFGAIAIDRDQIIELAEQIRRDFPNVVITILSGTEQARYLDDFKKSQFGADRAETIRIFAQKPDTAGSNQLISIEFGPYVNIAMTQGPDEAWVLGRLETLKRDLKKYERAYVTGFKKWGINFNQIIVLGTLVVLPSLGGLKERSILMAGVLVIILGVYALHSRYVPFASIYLRERKVGPLGRFWGTFASWVIGIAAAALATALAAYLQGYLTPKAPDASTSQNLKKGD